MTLIIFAVFSLLAVSGVLSQTEPPISRNPCQSFVCQNGGRCISPVDFPICQCPSGFGGNNCENQVPVKIGTCPADPNVGIVNCRRGCDNDFNCTGTEKCCNTFCERQCTGIARNPCQSFVCQNGGRCISPVGFPICQCPSGFGGNICENQVPVKIGTCPADPTLAILNCNRGCDNDFNCTGTEKCCNTFCERQCTSISRNPCQSFVCQNNGTCISPVDFPICQCPSGFGGNNCENQVPVKIGTCPADPNFGIVNCTRGCDNDFNCTGTEKCCNTICERQCTSISRNPCQSFVCQNGGRCISPVDVPICQCLSGFGGNNCENQVPVKIGTCPTDPNIGIVNCTRGCDNDFNCTGTQKCCNTTCERQCTSISRNPCQSFVCQNNGTCISPVDFPICQCPSGFGGNNCENQVPVKIGKCPTNLTLAILNCNRGCDNDFNCTGTEKCCNTICERQCTSNIIRDPCSGFVCLNGGTCTAPADAASCQCPPGFSGPTCEFSDRPGTCPVIEFIIRMTCVGVPCTSDQQCPSNQKCCTVTCGETLCTDVEPPPTLTCANVRCNVGSVCRNVSTCSSCPIGPTCVPVDQVYDGIDNDCRRQNYTQAVLLENPSNRSEYNQLTCASRFRTCPPGSDCAGGLCCQGKVTIPLTKPGLCPVVPVCKITDCTNDYDCPGEQKCCPGCGKSCRDPVFVKNEDQCRNTRCPPGLVCVLRTPVCPPGRSCIQIVIPVCVLPQCANCTANEDCVPSGSGFVCTTLNQCGGCPLGQVCRPTRRFCLRTPCPQFACVPIDICGECTGGQVCRPISCIVKTLSTLLNFSNNGIGRLIG